ncbi:MAG: hypothetical protein JWN29_2085, partial [Acidimicrobiales bacterium]|nr:hypothetical protein [Acidimicrobiales bacterium]
MGWLGSSAGTTETDDFPLSSAVGAVVGGVGAIVAGGLLASVRHSVSRADVALVLMVLVVVGAAIGGRSAGMTGAVAATLSFDFWHTRPYYTLRISAREDMETAVLLLIGGLVVGQIGARARASRAAVEAGRSELRRIHR